jgi:hypothetical protein
MADTAVVNGKAKKAGGKRKTLAEKMAEESSKIIGDLKGSSGRQTRNAAKGIVYKPPVKKARAPKDPNAKRGRPAKKEAAKEEAPAADKKDEAAEK